MIKAISCGGVVIHKGKILLLYKDYKYRYAGWVLPKGKVEKGEDFMNTALREVKEEANVDAKIISYMGATQYNFNGKEDIINKTVHWYLMKSFNFYTKPQREEFFIDAGYYKLYEAYHLVKFKDERDMLEKAYYTYVEMRKNNEWTK